MKKNKTKIVFFVCAFWGMFFLLILSLKFFGFRDWHPNWKEIWNYLPLWIIGSLGFAAWATWGGLCDELLETFTGKYRKKKKENN